MLLDDHAVVRQGLVAYLAQCPTVRVVGECATGRELLIQLGRTEVDLLLVDYSLQHRDADGLNLIRMLRIRYPHIKILVVTAHESPLTAKMALRAGANGFVGKSQDLSDLANAIHCVMRGEDYVPTGMSNLKMFDDDGDASDSIRIEPLGDHLQSCKLTAREVEVIRCCLEGYSVTQIAEKFCRSVKTVSGQKQRAFRKLGIANDHELFQVSRIM
ncbi:response regulator transcription factor [Burkholderia sp. MS455]|uniref:response regulator transcription factor n=1 Tax=Burkholderia sp. MS455 TaxID=2811788 RepID=UPI001EF3E0D1|nr:response regulator transcription factor [Burkholderia sp. MS455]